MGAGWGGSGSPTAPSSGQTVRFEILVGYEGYLFQAKKGVALASAPSADFAGGLGSRR